MSERREFNASNIEEALERASSSMGLDRSALSYEILDEGSSGFLGLGARDARIIVNLPAPGEPASPPEVPTVLEEPRPSEASLLSNEDDSFKDSSFSLPGGASTPEAKIGQEDVSEEFLEEVRAQVETTLDAMAFDGEVSVRDDGEAIAVDIDSEDAGLLIGQKGETIDAVQYLVNVAVYRNRQFSKKVILDCGGYRERRSKAVQGMAHRSAKRVLREGKAVELPPMSSSERRAVHSYLEDNSRVTTSSTGNDENRRVTISPS
jgi:spoIIIJ-associated protein